MNYEDRFKAFTEFLEKKCLHETLYDDSEGRTILVISLLDAFAMAERWKMLEARAERQAILNILWDYAGRKDLSDADESLLKRLYDLIRARGEP